MRLVQTDNTTILDARVGLVEAFISNVVQKTVNNMLDLAIKKSDNLTIEALKKLGYVDIKEENHATTHSKEESGS